MTVEHQAASPELSASGTGRSSSSEAVSDQRALRRLVIMLAVFVIAAI